MTHVIYFVTLPSLIEKLRVFIVWLYISIASFVVASIVKEKKCFKAKEAEACAIIYALRRARVFGFHKIHIVSDAQEVINTVNEAEDQTLRNFVEEIGEVCKSFVSISFSYVSRKFNGVTHSLAKFGFYQDDYFEWAETFPFLLNILNSL